MHCIYNTAKKAYKREPVSYCIWSRLSKRDARRHCLEYLVSYCLLSYVYHFRKTLLVFAVVKSAYFCGRRSRVWFRKHLHARGRCKGITLPLTGRRSRVCCRKQPHACSRWGDLSTTQLASLPSIIYGKTFSCLVPEVACMHARGG